MVSGVVTMLIIVMTNTASDVERPWPNPAATAGSTPMVGSEAITILALTYSAGIGNQPAAFHSSITTQNDSATTSG